MEDEDLIFLENGIKSINPNYWRELNINSFKPINSGSEFRNAEENNNIRQTINEISIFNEKLRMVSDLFDKYFLTEDEKINIISRFDITNTLSESKATYNLIMSELDRNDDTYVYMPYISVLYTEEDTVNKCMDKHLFYKIYKTINFKIKPWRYQR